MKNLFLLAMKSVSSISLIRRCFSSQVGQLQVKTIPALKDNFMYLLVDKTRKTAVAVDPVEPQKIFDCLKRENVSLKAVLTTHHHFDHAGGNELLLEKIKVPVYGGDDRIEAMTNKLSHEENIKIDYLSIRCLHTPCHTAGHVCYFVDSDEPICFTGDTLFVAGCGRFFEGSAEHMHDSLNVLKSLPLSTKIYCGHEYTLSNLKFALHVEPDNDAIGKRIKVVEECLGNNIPTVPSTIEDELSINPFMRADCKSVQEFTKQTDPVKVIKVLRELKDNFKG